MTDALSVTTKAFIFGGRSLDKAETNGDPVRGLIACGQIFNAAKSAEKLDGTIGQSAKTAVDAFKSLSKSDKLFGYAGKALKIVGDNINPLICISSGIDVLTSEDKTSAFITNGCALSSMFAVEHLMKKHLDDIPKMECMKGITEKVLKFSEGSSAKGKIPSIIHGVAFVIGSCTAYSVGQKFGELLVGPKAEQKS